MKNPYDSPVSNVENHKEGGSYSHIRKIDENIAKFIIRPGFAILVIIASIGWSIFWARGFFEFPLFKNLLSGDWTDFVEFSISSTASIFVALLAAKKWIIVLLNNDIQTKINRYVDFFIKVFAVPFIISLLFLLDGIYDVLKGMF